MGEATMPNRDEETARGIVNDQIAGQARLGRVGFAMLFTSEPAGAFVAAITAALAAARREERETIVGWLKKRASDAPLYEAPSTLLSVARDLARSDHLSSGEGES